MGNYITDCWSIENKRRRHIKDKSSKDEIFEDMEEGRFAESISFVDIDDKRTFAGLRVVEC